MHPSSRLHKIHPKEAIPPHNLRTSISTLAGLHTLVPVGIALPIADLRQWLCKAIARCIGSKVRDIVERVIIDDLATELRRERGLELGVSVADDLAPGLRAVVVGAAAEVRRCDRGDVFRVDVCYEDGRHAQIQQLLDSA